ncbi:MAG TPA: hypothetical protein VHH88_12355, partial [Verrucomicrobiae bacterium]|nr:hypothetical protein [Verrucomicrobiae bacterium]
GNPVVGSLGSIAKNGQVTVILTVKPQAEGNITNSAWVQSGYDDPNLPNNTNSLVTTVLPLPLLSIQTATGKQIKVSWPVLLTNYSLQFATNLAAPITWSTATNTPVISGAQRVVTETNSEREKFFRLKN